MTNKEQSGSVRSFCQCCDWDNNRMNNTNKLAYKSSHLLEPQGFYMIDIKLTGIRFVSSITIYYKDKIGTAILNILLPQHKTCKQQQHFCI